MTRAVFAYEPQARAVRESLSHYGLQLHEGFVGHVTPVRDWTDMRGFSADCTFIEIEDHGARIPNDIRKHVALQGFMLVVLSDRYARDRAQRREKRAEEIRTKGAGAAK